ncbi:MAG: tryptophan synthase subunit alpha [Clostridiales bacterium]|nr:tryptophan synthase subunit alpha [Clostridiales bacterium]
MNRIDEHFSGLDKKALITFLTVGDPDIETSRQAILTMQEEGADLIELGVPFSDPSADGPVIQAADKRAIDGGTDIFKVFELVEDIRDQVKIPMVFLLYYNIIVQYGAQEFFERCAKAGVDGLIIPDLPYEESDEIAEYTQKYGVYQINLVSPTSHDRIKKIAQNSKGFLYCVSSLGVTGEKSSFETNFGEFFADIKRYAKIPACVDFGISTGEQVRELSAYCDGAIVGSAIVKAIASGKTLDERMDNLRAKLRELRSGIE